MDIFKAIADASKDNKYILLALHRDEILLHSIKTSKQDTAVLLGMNYQQFTQWINHTKPYSMLSTDILNKALSDFIEGSNI